MAYLNALPQPTQPTKPKQNQLQPYPGAPQDTQPLYPGGDTGVPPPPGGEQPGGNGVPLPAPAPGAPPGGVSIPQRRDGGQITDLGQQQPGMNYMTGLTEGEPTAPTTTPHGGGSVDPNTALTQVQTEFSGKFGRPMTESEQQLAIQVAQQNGWSGSGPVPQAALDAVLSAIKTYNPAGTQETPTPLPGGEGTAPPTPAPGTPAPGTPAPPPPGTNLDPATAGKQMNDAFLAKLGHAPSQQELNWLYQMAGYTPGSPVTQDMLTKAMDAVNKYTGDIKSPLPKNVSPAEKAANDQLEKILGKDFGTVDLTAPENAGQLAQSKLRASRNMEAKRAAMAERAAQQGNLGTGGFDIDVERGVEQKGAEESAFESDLIASSLKDQKAQMMQAMQLALQTGQSEKAMQLQEKLATLDLDLKKYLGKGNLALGLLGAGNQNNQFYDQLGFNYAGLQNTMNKQAMDYILANGGY